MHLPFRGVAAGARPVAPSRQQVRRVRRSLVGLLVIAATGLAPVLGWWAGTLAW
jgi:hypothetical protein